MRNRMLLRVIFFLPILLRSAAGNFPFEKPKAGVKYEPPSRKFMAAPLDPRMDHWETQPRSNSDYEDRYRGEISYPSILEEPSLLRTPANSKVAEKSTSTVEDARENISYMQDSNFDRCIVDIFRLQPIVWWLIFSGARRNMRNPGNFEPEAARLLIPRCHRTRIQGRTMQEPIYVEEPGWVTIELNHGNSWSEINDREDPFYVTRGKKTFPKTSKNEFVEESPESSDSMVSTDREESEEFSRSTRTKRDFFNESPKKYLLESAARHLVSSMLTKKDQERSYLDTRNKHSDISDILNDPFFISRGKKKNSIGIQRSEYNDDYSAALINFEDGRRILDTWRRNRTKKNCDPNSSNCSLFGRKTNKSESEPFRDRRGIMEELLNEADPFYLARGKRSSDAIHEFNETTEIDDKNLSNNL